jgi:hypothetical protein
MEIVDVLIVNHRMGLERGCDIAERLLINRPNLRVMHISGLPREYLEDEGGLTPGGAFLSKPFTFRQIQSAIASLLA